MNSYLHQEKILDSLPDYVSIETEGYMWLWSYMYHVKWFDVWWHHNENNKEQEISAP